MNRRNLFKAGLAIAGGSMLTTVAAAKEYSSKEKTKRVKIGPVTNP